MTLLTSAIFIEWVKRINMANLGASQILFGILLLIFGKKLFWLSVGIIGFFAGMELAPAFFPGYSQLFVLIAALCLGFAGAILALVSLWFAIMAAGFLGIGYLFFMLFPSASYISFLIGGIVGIMVAAFGFNSVLIVVSSMVGAFFITQNLMLNDAARIFLFILLLFLGMLLQSSLFPQSRF